MVYFIIPACNEERNLPILVKKTKEAMDLISKPFRIFIINDGSTDGTSALCGKLAKEFPLEEIRFEKNRGVTRAFEAGFEKVFKLASDSDIIVTKEADNTSDPEILKKMIERVEAGYGAVFASCFAKEGRVVNSSPDRHILSFGANTILKIFFPIKGINTYSSFYRVFRAGVIRNAFKAYNGKIFKEDGFVCMVEMIVKLNRLSVKMAEVPMILRCDKREGLSKMRRGKTIHGYLKFIKNQLIRDRKIDRMALENFNRLNSSNTG